MSFFLTLESPDFHHFPSHIFHPPPSPQVAAGSGADLAAPLCAGHRGRGALQRRSQALRRRRLVEGLRDADGGGKTGGGDDTWRIFYWGLKGF